MSPKESNNDTARWVETWFQNIVEGRRSLMASWFSNLAMLYGHQWASFNQLLKTYQNYLQVSKDDRIRMTFNKIRSIMEARAAFIMGDLRSMSVNVKSTTDDPQDRLAALTAAQIINAFWQQEKLDTRLTDTWEWTKPCGISFMRLYFDPTWGRVVGITQNGTPLREGIIRFRTESPMAVALDPEANEWSEVRRLATATVLSFDDAKEIYGDAIDWDGINKAQYTLAPTSQYEMVKLLNDPGITNAVYSNVDADGKIKRLVRIEYWEKPTLSFPAGRHIVSLGGQLALDTGLELYDPETNDWDFTIEPVFEWREVGSLHSETPVSEMRSIQEQYNGLISKMFERSGMPDIYAFPSNGRWPLKFKSVPVLTGHYNPQFGAPQYIEGGRIRKDYETLVNLCGQHMEETAGVTQLQMGSQSPYMTGKLGFAVNESKRQVLTRVSNNFKQSITNLMRKYLRMVNKYYTEERVQSFIGEGDRREIVRFKGRNLGTNFIVTINLENDLEKSDPTATMQLLTIPAFTAMLQQHPERLKDVVNEIAPRLAHKVFYANTDVAVAEDENFEFSIGGFPPTNPIDDDDTHIATHSEYRKSDAVLSWDKQFVMNLDQHIQMHEMQKASRLRMAAFNMGQQAMLSGQKGGSPPAQPGTPSMGNMGPAKEVPPGAGEGA